mmetsp:Transcript_8095/g.25195  ORF Transcript_8095/g.25195 Transcript_8095/m.25195 type:complete len:143 (+) Transcript_8095:2863-3291(+)
MATTASLVLHSQEPTEEGREGTTKEASRQPCESQHDGRPPLPEWQEPGLSWAGPSASLGLRGCDPLEGTTQTRTSLPTCRKQLGSLSSFEDRQELHSSELPPLSAWQRPGSTGMPGPADPEIPGPCTPACHARQLPSLSPMA